MNKILVVLAILLVFGAVLFFVGQPPKNTLSTGLSTNGLTAPQANFSDDFQRLTGRWQAANVVPNGLDIDAVSFENASAEQLASAKTDFESMAEQLTNPAARDLAAVYARMASALLATKELKDRDAELSQVAPGEVCGQQGLFSLTGSAINAKVVRLTELQAQLALFQSMHPDEAKDAGLSGVAVKLDDDSALAGEFSKALSDLKTACGGSA